MYISINEIARTTRLDAVEPRPAVELIAFSAFFTIKQIFGRLSTNCLFVAFYPYSVVEKFVNRRI